MGTLVARPSDIIAEFRKKYSVSPEEATSYYYHLSRKSNYIREYRIKNDIKWITKTDYGGHRYYDKSVCPKTSKAIAAVSNADKAHTRNVSFARKTRDTPAESTTRRAKTIVLSRLQWAARSGIFNILRMFIIMSIV